MTENESCSCHGGIVGAGDDGFPVFCEGCLAGLVLALDWLVQRMSVVGMTLEYAAADAPFIGAVETTMETLIAEHDRVLVLYDGMGGYNARTNPGGEPVGEIPYWPRTPPRNHALGWPRFVPGRG